MESLEYPTQNTKFKALRNDASSIDSCFNALCFPWGGSIRNDEYLWYHTFLMLKPGGSKTLEIHVSVFYNNIKQWEKQHVMYHFIELLKDWIDQPAINHPFAYPEQNCMDNTEFQGQHKAHCSEIRTWNISLLQGMHWQAMSKLDTALQPVAHLWTVWPAQPQTHHRQQKRDLSPQRWRREVILRPHEMWNPGLFTALHP